MPKLIKKKDCKFKAGQIVCGDEVVGIPHQVWYQLNKLELMWQQYSYLKRQPKYQKVPSLDGFVRQSALKSKMPYIEVIDTPVTDKRFEESMKFMAEQEQIAAAAETNEMLDKFQSLVIWLDGKRFVEGDCIDPIDTPFLGNPLMLEPEAVSTVLLMIAESPIDMGYDHE